MSQKNSLQTVRPFFKGFSVQNMAPLKFLKGLNFLKNLDFFFFKKSVIPVNSTLNFVGQKGYLTLFLFVRMAKSVKLNRRLRIFRAKKAQESISSFSKFVFSNLKELRINALSTKVVLLNKVFSEKQYNRLLRDFFLKHRFAKDSIFNRRNNLFFDFVKLSCLFSKNFVDLKTYMFILVQTFRFLPKHKHARFFNFIKKNFTVLLENGLKFGGKGSISGLKFLAAGKLKGKMRKKKFSVQVGKVPIQSVDKNVEFVKAHVFTRFGVFGFKLWSYRI